MTETDQRRMIAVLAAGNFVIGVGAFVVIGILVPMAEDLQVRASEAGLVLTVYAFAYAVLSPVLVAMTGEIGRRRILVIGLGLFALATLGSAIAPTPEMLFASRIAVAAGAGLFTPNTAAVAAAISTPETRGRMLAGVFFGITLAQVIGVPAGSLLAYTVGWRATLGCVALLAIPCMILLWRFVPRGLEYQPTRLSTLGAAVLDWRGMIAIGFTVTFMSGIYVVYTYLAPLLAERMGFGGTGISIMLLLFGFGAVIGNLVGGLMTDRLGPGLTLRILVTVHGSLLMVYSLLPLPVPVVAALVLVWSASGWSFVAPQQTRLLERRGEGQSVTLALNSAAIYIGAAIGSAIGAVVIEEMGTSALGFAGGSVCALALLQLVLGDRLIARSDARLPADG